MMKTQHGGGVVSGLPRHLNTSTGAAGQAGVRTGREGPSITQAAAVIEAIDVAQGTRETTAAAIDVCPTVAVRPLSASIVVAQGTKETAAVAIEAIDVAPGTMQTTAAVNEVFPTVAERPPSVASPTLMRFQVDVRAGDCSWNNVNKVPGPLPSPEPITGLPVDLGPVVTASASCQPVVDLPISCGLDQDLQVISDSDPSPPAGRRCWSLSGTCLSVRQRMEFLLRPRPARLCSPPLFCYPGVPSSCNPTSTARHICKASPSVLASTLPSPPAQVLQAGGRCFSAVGGITDDAPADGWPGC